MFPFSHLYLCMPVTLNIVSSHLNQSLVKPGSYRGHPPAGGQLSSRGGETGQEGRSREEVAHESHIYDHWQEGRRREFLLMLY